jgi:tetratricopeptide (TPR) repeat protein
MMRKTRLPPRTRIPHVGIHQVGFDGANDEEFAWRTEQMLSRSLNTRTVIAVVGSGISMAYAGQPSWDSLIKTIVRYTLAKGDPSPEDTVALREIQKRPAGKVFVDRHVLGVINKHRSGGDSLSEEQRRSFKRFLRSAVVDDKSPSPLARVDRFLMLTDLCDEIFSRLGEEQRGDFRQFIAGEVCPSGVGSHARPNFDRHPTPNSSKYDPLRLIISRLKVRRFLTTNYDPLIENMLFSELNAEVVEHRGPGSHWPSREQPARIIARSLSYSPGIAEELVQFAAAAPGYEHGVFHLHGTAWQRDSMVLTERDYQRVYLSEDPDHRAFRDALEVAFAGNPILFLGMGMEEADLLRPLRQFVTEESRGGYERPLFALLPNLYYSTDGREMQQYLYTRYGVKTLFYPVDSIPDVPSGDLITARFCDAVDRLATGWTEWWDGWQQKPAIRKPQFRRLPNDNRVMVRHYVDAENQEFTTPDCARVLAALPPKAGALLVWGQAGTGKATLGQDLVQTPECSQRYDRRYFATAHFTNDFLSIIDAASSFFLGRKDTARLRRLDPLSRLKAALASGCHLMVVGGLERLLLTTALQAGDYRDDGFFHEDSNSEARRSSSARAKGGAFHREESGSHADYPPLIGRPLTSEIRDFLRLVRDHANAEVNSRTRTTGKAESSIVLTTSVVPIDLLFNLPDGLARHGPATHGTGDAEPQRSHVGLIELLGVDKSALNDNRFAGIPEQTRQRLHFSLRGHAYALAMVGTVLQPMKQANRRSWVDTLIRELSALDWTRRPMKAAELAISELLRRAAREDSARSNPSASARLTARARYEFLLQRAALFTTPVTADAIFCTLPSGWTTSGVKKRLITLRRLQLLLRVDYENDPGWRTTAHTIVRNSVLQRMGASQDAPGEPHRFDLAGWSNETPNGLFGADRGHGLTAQSVDAVLDALEADKRPRPTSERKHLIRAAFGLIRSRWTATAIPRLAALPAEPTIRLPRPHFDAYQRRLARLLNAVRATAVRGQLWSPENAGRRTDDLWQTGTEDWSSIEKPKEGILYADELAWLYNEMGLVAFCAGLQADAYALYRAGQHVNAIAERGSCGPRWCESEISLGLVHLERGRLNRAKLHFEYALRGARALGAPNLVARAEGHLALVHHILGNYDHAGYLYDRAIPALRAEENHRGTSIFLRHRADLRRKLYRLTEAATDLRESVAAAESGYHSDLLHYAHIAQANLRRATGEVVPIEELSTAIDFARKIGIPKMEWDAQIIQANLALGHAEYEMAGRLAIKVLARASSLGLDLRLTGSLILFAQVTKARGHKHAADSLLDSAIQLAERHGNQLQLENARRARFGNFDPEREALMVRGSAKLGREDRGRQV